MQTAYAWAFWTLPLAAPPCPPTGHPFRLLIPPTFILTLTTCYMKIKSVFQIICAFNIQREGLLFWPKNIVNLHTKADS